MAAGSRISTLVGQLDLLRARDAPDLLGVAEQHTARDPALGADRGGLHRARLVPFGQHDARVRAARARSASR